MYPVAGHPDNVIGIVRGCGHAIGPAPFVRVSRAVHPHLAECRSVAAAVLGWAADEFLAQDDAHPDGDMLDLTDHIRCFADQPERRSAVPWPELVPRPAKVMKSC